MNARRLEVTLMLELHDLPIGVLTRQGPSAGHRIQAAKGY